MLAKVFKGDEAAGIAAFSVPSLGGSSPSLKGVSRFVFPDFEGTRAEISLELPDPAGFIDDEDILQSARDEAARIIAEAEEHGEIIQQAASDKASHTSEVTFEAAVDERVADIRCQLADTISQLAALSAAANERAETGVIELAVHIAKKIVGREVEIDREIALNLVKVSLAKLHNRSVAKVHLSTADFAYVESHREALDFRGTIELIEDSSITAGGCLIHTETGDIDARIESQFDEIAHGLFA